MLSGIKIRLLAKKVDKREPHGGEEADRLYEQDALELADRILKWPSQY